VAAAPVRRAAAAGHPISGIKGCRRDRLGDMQSIRSTGPGRRVIAVNPQVAGSSPIRTPWTWSLASSRVRAHARLERFQHPAQLVGNRAGGQGR